MPKLNDLIKGLSILAKYGNASSEEVGIGEDDGLMAVSVPPEAMTEEDRQQLNVLCWGWSKKYECWIRYF